MRIEILQGHDSHKTYYQIERNELIIGSSNQCDVVLSAPEVSRRHLSLLIRGDRYFIIDHNSTNGTFLNEEKIEAGQKVEWSFDTPLRLATGVIITLVEDGDEADTISYSSASTNKKTDQTRTIIVPLAQLKATTKKKKTLPPPRIRKKNKSMAPTYLLVAIILGVAWYLNVDQEMKLDMNGFWAKPKAPPAELVPDLVPEGSTVEGSEISLPVSTD